MCRLLFGLSVEDLKNQNTQSDSNMQYIIQWMNEKA